MEKEGKWDMKRRWIKKEKNWKKKEKEKNKGEKTLNTQASNSCSASSGSSRLERLTLSHLGEAAEQSTLSNFVHSYFSQRVVQH